VLQRFVDDDQGYLAWVDEHPAGYVLNAERRPTRSFIVLHRATCAAILGATGPEGWTSTTLKVCAETVVEIDRWCREQVAGFPSRCRRCHP
jgi:hypothetical protein